MVSRACSKWSLRQAIKVAEEQFESERPNQMPVTVGTIQIFGRDLFAEEAQRSLEQLMLYPFGYRLVQRYVRAIVESKKPPKSGVFVGVVYQKSNDAGRIPWAASRFAALLVRRALTTRFCVGFELPSSSRSELIRLQRELRTMEILNCHPRYFPHQRQQIERVRVRSGYWSRLARLGRILARVTSRA